MTEDLETRGNRSLNVLIVEDSDLEIDPLQKSISQALSSYAVSFARAGNYPELVGRLAEAPYDIAFVDFDMNEESYKLDAVKSAQQIDSMQPSCTRVGMSIDGVVGVLGTRDALRLVFPIIMGKGTIRENPTLLYDQLKPYGF